MLNIGCEKKLFRPNSPSKIRDILYLKSPSYFPWSNRLFSFVNSKKDIVSKENWRQINRLLLKGTSQNLFKTLNNVDPTIDGKKTENKKNDFIEMGNICRSSLFYTGIWLHEKISVPNKKNFDNTQSK